MTPRPILAIGPFRLDPVDRLLSRDGRPVSLTPKAIDTLLVLVERRGRLVAKEELLRAVWPDAFVEENNLAQHISTLRRVLGEGLPVGPVIETVPRRGYRFVGPVTELTGVGPKAAAGLAVSSRPLRRGPMFEQSRLELLQQRREGRQIHPRDAAEDRRPLGENVVAKHRGPPTLPPML